MIIPTLSRQLRNKCRRYRWVYCQLDNLRRGFPASIRSALEQLPESLDEVYKHALLRIDKARREHAHQIFKCLAVPARPLRVEELAYILEVLSDKGSDSESNTQSSTEETIRFACSSLITIVKAADGSRVVQFSHFSVGEFLTSDRLAKEGPDLSFYRIIPEEADISFAEVCLGALLKLDKRIDRERIKTHPLADYASRHWFDHCRRLKKMPKGIHQATLRLFDPNKHHFSAWVWLYDMDDPSGKAMSAERPEPPKAAPLYYAVRGGFRWLVEDLVAAQGADGRGGYYETPLFEAFAIEDAKAALSLLQRGADANVLDSDGASVLHYASENGDVEFVWLLLKHNADLNLLNAEGQTPLVLSSAEGHLAICRHLVQGGANVNALDNNGRTPLWNASHFGHLDVVRYLIDNHADVNSADKYGRTPLWNASYSGHLDVVRYLIDNHADVNSADKYGWFPLQSAWDQRHHDVVQLLLDRGAVLDLRRADKVPPSPRPKPESKSGEQEAANFAPERITGSLDGAANPPISEETTSSSDAAQQKQKAKEEPNLAIIDNEPYTVSGNGLLDVVLFIFCLFTSIAYVVERILPT